MKKESLILVLLFCALLSLFENKPSVEKNEKWPEAPAAENFNQKKVMVIAFDSSGSMSGDNLIQAKKALLSYVSALPEDVEVGLVEFGGGVKCLSEIQKQDSYTFKKVVDDIGAGGGTPLGQAVAMSYNMLARSAQKSPSSEYHLVVITDGDAKDKDYLLKQVNFVLDKSPVRIFTIGFDIDTSHSLNMPGRTRYVSAYDEKQISQGLQKVLAEKEE